MSLFINDERGLLEPQNDLFATALLVIGFVVFAAIMSKTYLTYDEHSFALENYEEASRIAQSVASDELLHTTSPGIISASVLDHISDPAGGTSMRDILFSSFSGNFEFSVEVVTDDEKYQWAIEQRPIGTANNDVIAASVPVVIELNPAESVAGTLTVKMIKRGWI
ncbi:MAG: hypothetical protein K0A90_03775 [Methanosarcinaceae archaeon]|nr:hypothetical protein [Methanosarcinaceae archaeon]